MKGLCDATSSALTVQLSLFIDTQGGPGTVRQVSVIWADLITEQKNRTDSSRNEAKMGFHIIDTCH